MNYKEIKEELKNQGKSRAELAAVCMVAKKTVDSWLSEGRPIPALQMKVIEEFLFPAEPTVQVPVALSSLQAVSVIFTKSEVEEMERAAAASGKSLDDWARAALLDCKSAVLRRD